MSIPTECPRCESGYPSNAQKGEFEGLPSLVDGSALVCNQCSYEELLLKNALKDLPPRGEWPVKAIVPRE